MTSHTCDSFLKHVSYPPKPVSLQQSQYHSLFLTQTAFKLCFSTSSKIQFFGRTNIIVDFFKRENVGILMERWNMVNHMSKYVPLIQEKIVCRSHYALFNDAGSCIGT